MADVTQEQVAAQLGVRRQRIAAIEQTVRVTPSMAARYLAALERMGTAHQ